MQLHQSKYGLAVDLPRPRHMDVCTTYYIGHGKSSQKIMRKVIANISISLYRKPTRQC